MSFEQALAEYGYENCSCENERLFIGLGPKDIGQPVTELSDAFTYVCFFAAPEQVALLQDFVNSEFAQHVTHLFIGTSHDYAERVSTGRVALELPYYFDKAIDVFKGAHLPALKWLSIGDMELLFNGQALHGYAGDISPVFPACPNLETLEVWSMFRMDQIVDHAAIQEIGIEADGLCMVKETDEQVDAQSVTNLLSSRFENLRVLELDIPETDTTQYTIPEAFFEQPSMPALKILNLGGFGDHIANQMDIWQQGTGRHDLKLSVE